MSVQLRRIGQACAIFASAFFVLPLATADDQYVAKQDGPINVHCRCAVANPGCQSKVFDAIAGQERFEWTSPASTKKGTKYNLDHFCYRKRDVSGAGDGLCCEIPGNEKKSVQNLFRGEPR
ncbi:MAG TPA: hypothetical protein PLU47_16780 [Azonexus sp.]|nr:hypothetical protein [Azonexus sp.]